MSALLGADTERIDVIAEGLRGYSQDIQDLRTLAQRAVAELRNAWCGADFEGIAQRWEQEAGPRLADVSAALSTMAVKLRAQAREQRHASGNSAGTNVPLSPDGASVRMPGAGRAAGPHAHVPWDGDVETWDGEAETWDGDVERTLHGKLGPVEILVTGATSGNRTDTTSTTSINGHLTAIGESVGWGPNGEQVNEPAAADHVKVNLAEGKATLVDESLASFTSEDDNHQYELSVGKVEAEAEYSVDVDAQGNAVASAGVSAAAYAGYATAAGRRGNDFASGTLAGTAFVGAEVKADASGSFGPDGARGHLGAEAFAGGKVQASLGGTIAGVTAVAGAEISYGIGAHAEADAELSTTKIGVSVDIGATLGVGAGGNADVSVNPQEVIANVGHAVENVGDGLTYAEDQVAGFLDWK